MRAIALSLFMVGCTCAGSGDTEAPIVVRVVGGTDAASLDDATRPVDPAALFPVVLASGPDGAAATSFVLDLARPVWADLSDVKTAGSALTVTPPIDGALTWTSDRQLRFTPDEGLKPDTDYAVSATAIDSRSGVITFAAPAVATFHTPAFALLDVRLSEVRADDPTQRVDMVFSGAVDGASVMSGLTATVAGAALSPRLLEQPAPNVVRVELSSPSLVPAESVVVALQSGVAHSAVSPATATGKEVTVALPDAGKGEVSVLDVLAREGGSGFVVDVVCQDEAAAGDGHYYWDETSGGGWWLSSRCELDPTTIASHVHISPELPFEVVPSASGFRIRAAFQRGAYAIRLDAGATSVDQGVLRKPVQAELIVPARSPSLRFTTKGRYLPREAWGTLPVEHRNVSDVRLTVRHIPQRNLVFWMTGQQETADDRNSELVADTRVPLRTDLDATLTSWLDLTDAVQDPEPGVWEIAVASGGARDTTRLLVTDLQLLAKVGDEIDGVRTYDAWAVDIHDSHPIAEVAMQLVRASGQVVAQCNTNIDGFCALNAPKDVDPTQPVAIIATLGDDLTYLRFDDVRVTNAENEVGGEPWKRSVDWRAAVWTDRGVYRPGETAHLGAILRDDAQAPPKADMPVHIDIMDPRGRAWKHVAVVPNAAGLAALDVTLGDYATTGTYEAIVRVGDDAIGRETFMVEEFVPERLAVSATIDGGDRTLGDAAPVKVNARYLFGGSAAGARVEVACRLVPAPFKPKKNGQLAYGGESLDEAHPVRAIDLGTASGTLADDGTATVTCPPSTSGVGAGNTATLTADVAVFEAGSGRATHTTASVTVHPAKVYVGLTRTSHKADAGHALTVTGQIVDWTGATTSTVTEVQVETFLLQSEWDWSWDAEAGEQTLRRWRRPTTDGTTKATVTDGKFSVDVTPSQDADAYMVRVTAAGGATTDLVVDMMGWHGWWYGPESVDQTPRPLAPQQITIELPEQVKTGEAVEATFLAPFTGRALITVETDHVVEQRWMDVEEGPVTWSFSLDAFVPNVYVGVLAIKDPHEESRQAWLPDRAWGVRSLRVDPEEWNQKVTLTTPTEVKPGDTLTVGVDLGEEVEGPASVVIAAVDEGVLSLTKFVTPDPLDDLFPHKALGVDTYETVGWGIARPPGGPSMRSGGDTSAPASRVTMVKPVALWSGVVAVDAQGKATVSFTVPTYRGKLRIMAVAATPTRVGHAEASVTVRDPLVVQTTLPRFLIQGDLAQVPVFVTNTSGASQTVSLTMSAANLPVGGFAGENAAPIAFTGQPSASFTLADGASKTVVFRVRAMASVGAATFKVEAKAGKLVSRETLDVPFMPAGPRVRTDTTLTLANGAVPLAPSLTGWLPTTEQSTIWVTGNRYAPSLVHLGELIHYPYGCIEQTSSQTRALIYLTDLAPVLVPELKARKGVDDMVRQGLDRVLAMQTASGGFGYWPGDDEPDSWGTAYATHMLMDARDAGYAVPAESIEDAITWLSGHVTRAADMQNWDGWRYESAYQLYVLARAGRLDKANARSVLDGLKADNNEAATEARYLLRAALWLAGDRRDEANLRAPDAHPLTSTRHNDLTYWSDLRGRGVQLSVYQDLFGKDDRGGGEPLARIVADGLAGRTGGSYTTQELVWGLTGLGKRAAGGATSATLKLLDGGTAIPGEALAKGLLDTRWTVNRASERPSLSLDVAAVTGGKLYALITSTGNRTDTPWRYGGSTLTLARAWKDGAGLPVDLSKVKLGDVVYAVTTIGNTSGDDVRNVALSDRLPAGWEIESARVGADDGLAWLNADSAWSLDHLDARDDRIEAFGTVPAHSTQTVVFALRAVTAGDFTMPPAEAEAMYDPTVWARAPGATVSILGAWDAYWL